MILDSGERTEFESGAMRDMKEGRGRCDLLPLDVVADITNWGQDATEIFDNFDDFQKQGNVDFLLNCLYVFSRQRYGNDDTTHAATNMLLELSVHFEEGAKKYGVDNWKKGIPVSSYIDSAIRHYLKWLRGDEDERHDRAFCWNIMCAIWTCENMPELNNYAKKGE